MTFRDRFLDAVIDGHLGNGIVVTRKDLMDYFPDEKSTATGCFLSNSEIHTGSHSPTYKHFTTRLSRGCYRVHPEILQLRTKQRGIPSILTS